MLNGSFIYVSIYMYSLLAHFVSSLDWYSLYFTAFFIFFSSILPYSSFLGLFFTYCLNSSLILSAFYFSSLFFFISSLLSYISFFFISVLHPFIYHLSIHLSFTSLLFHMLFGLFLVCSYVTQLRYKYHNTS